MNLLIPILAAILQSGSLTIDKFTLSFRHVNYKTYTAVSFPLSFLITWFIFLIFHPPLSLSLFTGNLLLLLFISIGMTIATNLIFYRALGKDQLGEIQTLDLLHNFPIIIISSIIFTDERNFIVIFPALIASAVIFWSHWEHHHFKIAKNTWPFLIWSLTAASVGAPVSKMLLEYWNPISLELVRSGAMALILGILFSKYAAKISPRSFLLLLATNFLSSIAWILYYYSYQRFGIIFTVLIFSLQPLLVYMASLIFLKEPFRWKKALAFAIVLISIGVSQIIKYM